MLPRRFTSHLSNFALLALATGLGVPAQVGPLPRVETQAQAAQPGPGAAFIRLVRTMESAETDLADPVGLAFSANANVFHVVEGHARGARETDIIQVNPFALRSGAARVAVAVRHAMNMVFDDERGRLLIYRATDRRLLEVREGHDGSLDPSTLTRHRVEHFPLQNAQGMATDPATGALFFLEVDGPWIVRVEPAADGSFEGAAITAVSLQGLGLTDVRSLAFDPTTRHLHFVSPAEQKLYEVTEAGDVVATRDLSEFDLGESRGMVFAPSGDQTDDPGRLSLYLIDGGTIDSTSRRRSPQIIEFSLTPPPRVQGSTLQSASAAVAAPFTSTVVKLTDMSAWSPPSPDPSGLTYVPATNSLLMVDGEVEEIVNGITHFQGANVWHLTLGGAVVSTANISKVAPTSVPMSDEPTGLAANSNTGHWFVADDSANRIFTLNPGSDGLIGTSDDTWTSFSTLAVGNGDPEGMAYDPGSNRIFVADGLNEEIYEYTVTGTLVGQFDVTGYGVVDPEAVEFNPATGTLFILSKHHNPVIIETTRSGTLLQTIDVSAAGARAQAGLAYAPASDGSSVKRFYIVARGLDNDPYPNVIDGTMYEMTAPSATPPSLGPPAVGSITATVVSPTQIDLSWTSSSGATGYRLERSTNGTNWTTATTTSATTFNDTGRTPATTYYYRVIATNADGESAPSPTAQATTLAAGAIAFANLGSSAAPDLNSTTNATSYATASWTPPTTGLIMLFVQSARSGGPDTPAVSGNALTWVRIGSTLNAGNGNGLSVFLADAAGATTGPTTISFGSNTQTHCVALFAHATGVDLSAGVSAAVIQRPTGTGTGTNGSLSFATAGNAANRQIVAYHHQAAQSTAPRSGWTEFDDVNGSGLARGVQTQVKSDSFTVSSSASWSTSSGWGAVGLELKAEVPASVTAPAPPTNLTATAISSTQIDVSWTASSGATGYRVERRPGGAGSWTTAGPTTGATTFTDVGLADSTTYQYRVVATNGGGESAPSGTTQATTLSPGTTGNIVFTNLGSNGTPDLNDNADATSYATASWTPPTSDLIILFVQSYRAAGPDTPTVSGNGVTWVQLGTTLNTAGGNGLTVFLADAAGATTGPTTISFGSNTQTHCTALFAHAGGVELSGGVGAAVIQQRTGSGTGTAGSLTFGAAGHAANRQIVVYHHDAQQATTQNAAWTELDDASGGGRARGVETQVKSDSFSLSSSASWASSSAWGAMGLELRASGTPVAAPATPANVTAAVVSATEIDVSWAASLGASGYRVERRPIGGSWTTAGTTSSTTFSDTGLTPSTTYEYRVIATNNLGESAPSATAQATTQSLVTLPAPPTNVTATAVSSTQIDVSWTASNGAAGYRVERRPGGGNWATAGTTTLATTLSDPGRTASTTYEYRVFASNTAGESAPSAVAQATTPGGGGIVFTNLGASTTPDLNDNTDTTSYATGSWTPPTSGLIILFVQSNRGGGPDTPIVSGNGVTWVRIGTTLSTGGGNGLTVFLANAAGATPGATTIAFGTNVQTHCVALFAHATGVDLSGGVAVAVAQHQTSTGSGTSGSLTFAAAGNPANRQIVAYHHEAQQATTHNAAWTEFDDVNGGGRVRGVETQIKPDTFSLSSSASWATSSPWGAMGLELKANGTPVATPATPTSVAATAISPTQIDVSWTASSGATGYRVERRPSGGSWTTAGTTTGATTFNDTGRTPSTTYGYRVVATNAGGESAPSATAQATTPASGGANIVVANLGSSAAPDLNDNADATSYATASWTPPTSGLIILFVQSNRSGGPDTPTVSGNGLTWVQSGTTLNTGGGNGITVFLANASGATTGATTISFGTNVQTHCIALFSHATGVNLSGGVAAAVVQQRTATGTGTTASLTFAAAGHGANRQIVAFHHIADEPTTPHAAWTELDDVNGAGRTRGVETQIKSDAFSLSSTASWATSSGWGAIGLELKAQ